jgi:peptide/nickel transport system ATP-binding protein
MSSRNVLLSVRDLRVNFDTYHGVARVLNGVNFDVYEGEVLGVVGESGCGKSVTSQAILRLLDYPGEVVGGEIWFKGEDLLKLSEAEMRDIRGNLISMIFQDPSTFLNPVLTIGDHIGEAIELHQKEWLAAQTAQTALFSRRRAYKKAVKARVIEALRLVRMPDPDKIINQYPHELSGGMRQRCMIAIALACNPVLLIADEATTNLDVTIQARILNLLMELRTETRASMIMITHDMGVVAETCDRVVVMYAGDVVEQADVFSLFDTPKHPYTIGLLEAIPKIYSSNGAMLEAVPGTVPNPIEVGPGCRFSSRCPYVTDICRTAKPDTLQVGPDHFVACHHLDTIHADPKESVFKPASGAREVDATDNMEVT